MRPRKKMNTSEESFSEETEALTVTPVDAFILMVTFLKAMSDEKNRKARVALTKLEELTLDEATHNAVRKIILDSVNDYYRSMYIILAKNVE